MYAKRSEQREGTVRKFPCLAFAALVATSVASGASAAKIADETECKSLLIPDKLERTDSLLEEMAVYELIDNEDEFQKAKSATGSAGYKLFSASANYEEFEKSRETFRKIHSIQSNKKAASRLVSSSVPASAYNAFVECVKIKNGGLAVYVADISPFGASIYLNWSPPSGVYGELQFISVEGMGISADSAREMLKGAFRTAGTRALPIKREIGKEARLTITVAEYTQTLLIPPYQKPRPSVWPGVYNADAHLVNAALDAGASPDELLPGERMTPLVYAIEKSSELASERFSNIALTLLGRQASPNLSIYQGVHSVFASPLYYAADACNPNVTNALIQRGAALDFAIHDPHGGLGVDKNGVPRYDKWTPLKIAEYRRQIRKNDGQNTQECDNTIALLKK